MTEVMKTYCHQVNIYLWLIASLAQVRQLSVYLMHTRKIDFFLFELSLVNLTYLM
jgi:hypothetical protein